jgi:AraC-like DNA-binding protein
MRQARKMLRDGRHQVQEVAMRLGFASPSHMSRRFKSFYRVSPSEMIPK